MLLMTLLLSLISAMLLLVPSPGGQTSANQVAELTTEQQAIRELDRGILVARVIPFRTGRLFGKVKVPVLEEVLAAEYRRINSRGRLFTKAEELEISKGINLPGTRRGQAGTEQIRVTENMAMVRSIVMIENSDNSDLEPTGSYRVINIYTRQNERWLLLSSQWTTISE